MSNCNLTQNLVFETVRSALVRLIDEDIALLELDANERSISHRLAIHIEQEIRTQSEWETGLHVDCEYNRDIASGTFPYKKTLDLPSMKDSSADDTDAKTVFPDIIIHRRGSKTNLVVVELKKQGGSAKAKDFDRTKVCAYLSKFSYSFGVFLVLGVGKNKRRVKEFTVWDRTSVDAPISYPCGVDLWVFVPEHQGQTVV